MNKIREERQALREASIAVGAHMDYANMNDYVRMSKVSEQLELGQVYLTAAADLVGALGALTGREEKIATLAWVSARVGEYSSRVNSYFRLVKSGWQPRTLPASWAVDDGKSALEDAADSFHPLHGDADVVANTGGCQHNPADSEGFLRGGGSFSMDLVVSVLHALDETKGRQNDRQGKRYQLAHHRSGGHSDGDLTVWGLPEGKTLDDDVKAVRGEAGHSILLGAATEALVQKLLQDGVDIYDWRRDSQH